MRILHIVPYFYPAWSYGGTPRAVYEIAKRQAKSGHDVTVFTTNAFDGTEVIKKSQETVDGIKIKRFKNLSNFMVWNLRFPIPLKMFSEDFNKFDLVHIHETRNLLNIAALYKFNGKLVFSPWGTLPFNDQQIAVKKIFDTFLIDKLKTKTFLSLAQNNHELDLLGQWGIGKNRSLLPLGIDLDFFKNNPKKNESRKKLNLSKDDKIFLFLGRFSPAKGIGLLIKSFLKATQKHDNIKLLLVGRDDGYLSQINTEESDKVIVHGPLYGEDRLLAYAAADYFIFTPTVYEETATVCLEALASKLPVIVTKQAQIPFFDLKDGVIEINDNEKEIVESINYVLKNQIKINKQKLENFNWDKIVNKLESLYYDTQK